MMLDSDTIVISTGATQINLDLVGSPDTLSPNIRMVPLSTDISNIDKLTYHRVWQP